MKTTKATYDFQSPKITDVSPGDRDYVLNVTWGNGEVSRIDMTEPIFRLRHLRPLRNRELFQKVKVEDWGWGVSWGDDLEYSGENLWELAIQQAKAVMIASDFRHWMVSHNLTHQLAADLLGVSKRSIDYYAIGAQPITRTIKLALLGVELELKLKRQKQRLKDKLMRPAERESRH